MISKNKLVVSVVLLLLISMLGIGWACVSESFVDEGESERYLSTEFDDSMLQDEHQYNLTVIVYAGDNETLEGASVRLEEIYEDHNETAETNESGIATFEVSYGTYELKIEKEGYQTVEGSVEVDEDTVIEFTIEEERDLSTLMQWIGLAAILGVVFYALTKIDSSATKTFGLFGFMFVFFVIIGFLLGEFFMDNWILGAGIFLMIATVMNLVSYFYSHKIILKSHKAKIIGEEDNPRLFRIVRDVAREADIEMPKVAIIPSDTPNAFATGRNEDNAVVAATKGILDTLNDEELKGVMAHEVAHIKGKDMLLMSIAATLAGAITFMTRMVLFQMMFGRRRGMNPILLLTLILAPIGALIIKMAISRKREYEADEKGAEISKNPNALADALEKLNEANSKNPMKSRSTTSSSLFIVNPFKGKSFANLFSSHPPMEERVKRLREMASDFSYL